MKIRRYDSQTQRQHKMKNPVNQAKQEIRLVLALVGLIIVFALPINFGMLRAANQTATPLATNPGWVQTGAMNTARYAHTATLLEHGYVLVAGGGVGAFCECCCGSQKSSLSLNSAELYDPVAQIWLQIGSLNSARFSPLATRLEYGEVLIAGGYLDVYYKTPLNSAELYDPGTGEWQRTGDLNVIRTLKAIIRLGNDKVLAVGASIPDHYATTDRTELYDPATGTWSATDAPDLGGYTAHMVLLPNGKVLAISEANEQLYDPTTEKWSNAVSQRLTGFPQTVTLLANGKVLVVRVVGNRKLAELYDPNTQSWSLTATPPHTHHLF